VVGDGSINQKLPQRGLLKYYIYNRDTFYTLYILVPIFVLDYRHNINVNSSLLIVEANQLNRCFSCVALWTPGPQTGVPIESSPYLPRSGEIPVAIVHPAGTVSISTLKSADFLTETTPLFSDLLPHPHKIAWSRQNKSLFSD